MIRHVHLVHYIFYHFIFILVFHNLNSRNRPSILKLGCFDMSNDFLSLIRWSVTCWVFFELVSLSLVVKLSLANFEVLDQLPFCDFSSASFTF
jgi:hypothetical protein